MLYLETSSQTFGVPIVFGCWKEVLVINLLSTQETTSINSRKSPSPNLEMGSMMFCSLIWPLRWFRVRLPKGIAMLRIYFNKTHEMVIPSGKLKCRCLHSHRKNMISNINHCLEWEINQDHKNRKAGIIRGSYHWTGETQDNKTPSLNELNRGYISKHRIIHESAEIHNTKKKVDHESILPKHVR